MRLHVLSVPHTSTTEAHSYCAFTSDVRDFCTMMTLRGHDVFLYAGPDNEALCTEHIPLVTHEWQLEHFGEFDHGRLFPHDIFAPSKTWNRQWNIYATEQIKERIEPGDVLLTILGVTFAETIDEIAKTNTVAEMYVGYPTEQRHTRYCNYVSYAHRNYCEGWDRRCFLDWPNSVVANPFPLPNDVHFNDGGYLLFVGRKNESKGLHIANDIAIRTGIPLVVAGQGPNDLCRAARYAYGVVTGGVKKALIEGAHAVLVPSIYGEPFGKIVAEANLLGTPVITSDFGAFSETVVDGFNGQRCRTMREFLDATQMAFAPPEAIAQVAANTWAYDAVGDGRPGLEMEKWLTRLTADSWYAGSYGP